MPKRFFRPSSSGIAALILAFSSLLSYIFGLARDILISRYFGIGPDVDAYNTAFAIPDLLYTITVAGALSGILLPIFRSEEQKNEESGWQLISSFLLTSQILVFCLSLLAFVFMPQLSKLIAQNAAPEQLIMITKLSRILLLSPLIFSISNGLGIILNTFKHYLAYALSSPLYNGGIILGITLWHEQFGIMSAAYGVALGLILHLAIRLIDIRQLKSQFSLTFWHQRLPEIYKKSFPKTLGLLSTQFSLISFNTIGYTLIVGSIAAFNYARNIQSFAVSLFGIATATAIFPFLVDLKTNNQVQELRQELEKITIQICLFTIPATVGLFLLSQETVSILLGRGAFDNFAINLTSGVLTIFALSIATESLSHLYARAFYVYENVKTPVIINLIMMTITILIAKLFSPSIGVNAFGLAFVSGSFIQLTLLFYFFQKNYIKLNTQFLLKKISLIALGSLLMGIIIISSKKLNLNAYLSFATSIVAGTSFYFIYLKSTNLIEYSGLHLLEAKLKKLIK